MPFALEICTIHASSGLNHDAARPECNGYQREIRMKRRYKQDENETRNASLDADSDLACGHNHTKRSQLKVDFPRGDPQEGR